MGGVHCIVRRVHQGKIWQSPGSSSGTPPTRPGHRRLGKSQNMSMTNQRADTSSRQSQFLISIESSPALSFSPLAAKKNTKMLAVRGRVASRALFATRAFASTARILSDEPPKPPRPIDDSTSALDYKTSHKVKPPPLPKMDLPRSRSAEEAVTNILYNTPPPSLQPFKK